MLFNGSPTKVLHFLTNAFCYACNFVRIQHAQTYEIDPIKRISYSAASDIENKFRYETNMTDMTNMADMTGDFLGQFHISSQSLSPQKKKFKKKLHKFK